LPPDLLRDLHHGELEDRVSGFIADGQRAGVFRTDLPLDWLIAAFHAVIHAAANEVDLGRLESDEAADVVTATLVSVVTVPPSRRSRRT
jgi:hypothetical protein